MPTRAARSRLRFISLVALALAGLATACTHPCEADPGTIPSGLNDADLVVDGGTACGGGGADEGVSSRIYHPGTVQEWAAAYMAKAAGSGWERVACKGGELSSSVDPDPLATISECFVKNGEVANIEVYPYGHHLLGVIPRDGAVAYVTLDPSDPYRRP